MRKKQKKSAERNTCGEYSLLFFLHIKFVNTFQKNTEYFDH